MHCGRELSPSWSVKNDLSRELSSCGDWSSGAGQQLGSDCDPCRGLGGGLEWGLRAVGGGQSVGRSMEGGMCPREPYPVSCPIGAPGSDKPHCSLGFPSETSLCRGLSP